ncbi:hypothetical protein [Algoriphagus sp. Y33]|uniref:DUF7683 domain-containing protein n=1 Tax=Algoriphagus sp. Y33 TaxID=2772483 RepID=UPI001782C6DB|nr:hypothetical protein [Algoriphagus sp. Y33]
MTVNRIISKYYIDKEDLIEEIVLPEVDLEWLSSCFNVPESDYLLYNSYKIGREEYEKLSDRLNFNLELDKFEYYLEAYDDS